LGPAGREYTLEEVGEYFAVTRERVCQIEAKAIAKLQTPSRGARLAPFAPVRLGGGVNKLEFEFKARDAGSRSL